MFGVGAGPIGVFVGAFAVATSLMFVRFLPERLRNRWVIGSAGLALTVIPLLALVPDAYALYLPFGRYGTTVAINEFLVGSLLGATLLAIAPLVSARLADLRKKRFPYQGVVLTISMLIMAATIMQVVL